MAQTVPAEVNEHSIRKRSFRGLSLRMRLVLLVSACVLPLFGFGFGNAYSDYQTDRADAGKQALDMTRTLSLLVQRDLEARLSTLQALTLSQTLQTGDLTAFRTIAEAVIAQQMPGSHIVLLRENGEQIVNTAQPAGTPLPVRRDTTSLRRLFVTAQPSVSDVFIDGVAHRPVIALEVPVLRPDGSVIYSLTLHPSVDTFAQIVHRQHLATRSIVSILDRQGTIIARTPNDAEFVGTQAGTSLLSRVSTQSEGFFETTSQDGVPVVAAFSHVPNVGWSVVIGVPRAELIATAKRATLVTFGVGTACLVLGLALAQAMARRIARPIASLRALSLALEQNEPDITTNTGLTETDEVAQALVAALRRRQIAETASRQAEQETEQAAALLRTVVETASSLIYAKDQAGRMVLANGAYLDVLGKNWDQVVGKTDLDFRDDQTEAKTVMDVDRRIMAAGQAEACEELIGNEGNQPRVWLCTKTPLRDARKEIIGLVGVSVEITDRKQVEDRLRLMVNELNHRVKNTLATVQSIASHTLRGADRAVRRTLDARLMALASAHDVLTREGWEGANLADVIAGALAPYGGVEGDQFKVGGPPLRLQPRAAVAVAMGLHELATNALKYGALSVDGGQVKIQWAIIHDTVSRLQMSWSERGGPPVFLPIPLGFGTRLIERSLAQDLGGTAQIIFAPEGIICLLDAPLEEVVTSAAVMVFPRVGNMQ